MVSAIVAAGIPTAKVAYEKVVLSANAETLMSTTVFALRNELGTAKDVQVEGNAITYYNESRGTWSQIYLDDIPVGDIPDTVPKQQTIYFRRYVRKDDMGKNSNPVRLISKTAATWDLYVTFDSVSVSNGIITFQNMKVNRESGTKGLVELPSVSIRIIYDHETQS
jgi:hypothetical protein